jgi:hypothetical protein
MMENRMVFSSATGGQKRRRNIGIAPKNCQDHHREMAHIRVFVSSKLAYAQCTTAAHFSEDAPDKRVGKQRDSRQNRKEPVT